MTTPTATAPAPVSPPPEILDAPVPFDLYREVHKGIRLALFDLTVTAGRADGSAAAARADVVARAEQVVRLLHTHHGHEDAFIQPLVEAHAPHLAPAVDAGHVEAEEGIAEIERLAGRLASCADADGVAAALDLYHHLALFTSNYLAHMAFEELELMAALRDAVSIDVLFGVEVAIRSTVPPPLMVEFMGIMLPAMTTDERVNMLGGMKAGAPPEIFALFWDAARGALSAADLSTVADRIGGA